jgi:hypothetical protein
MTRTRLGRLMIVATVLWLAAACGSSTPSSPAAVIPIAGNWSGTWSFVTSGVTVTDNVTVTFTQASSATGTWSADNGATGTFQFAVASTVTGTMVISQSPVGGGTCSATGNLTGSVSSTAMTLTVPTLPATAQCSWSTNNQFSLHR